MTSDGDKHTPLRKQLNLSGIPFQLRVEELIRDTARDLRTALILREVPAGERFLDIVCGIAHTLVVFECKRVTDKDWVFVTDSIQTRNECRLEYFNSNADENVVAVAINGDRVFVDTWLLNIEIPEAEFCVSPKDSAVSTIETVCRDLIAGCHDLLGDEGIAYAGYVVGVPIVVTTAKLWLCEVQKGDVDLNDGSLTNGKGSYREIDAVRFTKTFATRRSNFYDDDRVNLVEWADDRRRTVFVMNPTAIANFLRNCDGLLARNGRFGPQAFMRPPKPTR